MKTVLYLFCLTLLAACAKSEYDPDEDFGPPGGESSKKQMETHSRSLNKSR